MSESSAKNHRKFGARCRMVDLSEWLNWPRRGPEGEWWRGLAAEIRGYPEGLQKPWGVPFAMAEGDKRRVIMARRGDPEIRVPLAGKADYLCFLHCWRERPEDVHPNDPPAGLMVGEYELAYADGERHIQPIRARFEANLEEGIGPAWVAMHWQMPATQDPAATPLKGAWGRAQVGLRGGGRQQPIPLLVYPMPNPRPDKTLHSLTIRGLHESPLLIAALTLYRGADNPLRHLPRRMYRVRTGGQPARIKAAEVDLGVVARIERAREPRDKRWLDSKEKGRNLQLEPRNLPRRPDADDLIEVTGAPDATVSVALEGGRKALKFSLGEAFHEGRSASGKAALEVLGQRRQWMTVRVIDSSTGRPTPARVHFSGPRGEYIAPYGHHAQINYNWFEDYGADVVAGGQNFAYVSGEFTTDLPVGDLYVDIFKGFEYEPIRMKTRVEPGQKTLELRINRLLDLRRQGWVTADTHVHFISPQTAWLQAQCEGVNVVNLLASQWGRLFTNVGDLSGRVGVVEDDTVVYVGTENRNHMLGHMSMLGTQGLPVFPMCCGGPMESWVGDPDFVCLAEWARENRKKRGVVIRPHFPFCGNTEDPVPILLGLVDALEIRPRPELEYPTQKWYRYLNCGYRVAVCGGTDKMCAAQPLGWQRTYALLDPRREFTYDGWAEAVRAGRTVSTNGPVMGLQVEGRDIGDTIEVPPGGATVEAHATAQCYLPMGRLEIVLNGRVVARKENSKGAARLDLREKIRVPGCGWIAARCSGLRTHPGAYAAAHTSPIYIKRGGDRLFDGPAAEHFLSHVEGGLEYLQTLATVFDEASRNRMVKLFNEARRELLSRLEKEGVRRPHHGAGPYHVHAQGGAAGHRHE